MFPIDRSIDGGSSRVTNLQEIYGYGQSDKDKTTKSTTKSWFYDLFYGPNSTKQLISLSTKLRFFCWGTLYWSLLCRSLLPYEYCGRH